MKITYIQHSGFAVELDDRVLIFDYYRGALPEFDREKEVWVFASHAHYDHFQPCIFAWAERFPRIFYVLSSDIRIPGRDVCRMRPGQQICAGTDGGRIRVEALRSTYEGVAFLVRTKERTIYHAGDLNWWHWEEASDRYNALMEKAYKKEIGKLAGVHIDAAFVPVDPRLGAQYHWGLDWFMRQTDTDLVFPMHMQGRYDLYDRLMEEPVAAGYRGKIAHITGEGQVFAV